MWKRQLVTENPRKNKIMDEFDSNFANFTQHIQFLKGVDIFRQSYKKWVKFIWKWNVNFWKSTTVIYFFQRISLKTSILFVHGTYIVIKQSLDWITELVSVGNESEGIASHSLVCQHTGAVFLQSGYKFHLNSWIPISQCAYSYNNFKQVKRVMKNTSSDASLVLSSICPWKSRASVGGKHVRCKVCAFS